MAGNLSHARRAEASDSGTKINRFPDRRTRSNEAGCAGTCDGGPRGLLDFGAARRPVAAEAARDFHAWHDFAARHPAVHPLEFFWEKHRGDPAYPPRRLGQQVDVASCAIGVAGVLHAVLAFPACLAGELAREEDGQSGLSVAQGGFRGWAGDAVRAGEGAVLSVDVEVLLLEARPLS
uniref:hypothetical protein n=1 Tax=Streptomyces sp. NBC_01562 TaxID=2975879 RepID=UPI002F91316E